MKKIVELIIKLDDLELEGLGDLGVDAMALVENPAIELDFLAFKQERSFYVDNEDYMHFKKFLDENKDLMKKPGGGPAGEGGVDHGAQMAILKEQGIDTEYPFGYCFQIAQFVFYALGGYNSEWDLMCIKGMKYQVAGHDFQSTHWYVQNKNTGQIVDLSAEQFDEILDINEHYANGRRANLGFPYYNVDGDKVMFDNTVPSLMTLKLYSKWKEEHGELEGIEDFYQACKYEEQRMSMQFSEEDLPYAEEFVKPTSGETEAEFIGRCIPQLIDEGYEQDQAVAVCYSYWQDGFGVDAQLPAYVDQVEKPKHEEMSAEHQTVYEMLSVCGEEYDPHTAVFVDASRASFSTLQDFLTGITALDILGQRGQAGDAPGETVYRYSGPLAERGFCRAMLRLNKVYRRQEVASLNSANPGFGRGGSAEYSVFNWKGGPNCRHYWEELTMFKSQGRTVFLSHGPVMGSAGMTNNIDAPSALGSVTNNAYLTPRGQFSFNADEEQRIVTGPAMIPNKMILRKDENGNPYYVYFTQKTVKDIAERVFEENKHNMTNIEHNSKQTNAQNTLLESWIVLDPEKDKSAALGFNVPQGTWMVSYKINDDTTWQLIKEGKLRGFSVEGFFIEKAEAAKAQKAAEQMYNDIMNILKQVE